MRSVLFIILTLASCLLQAQTMKGSWLLGGNAHIRYELDAGPKGWNANLNPNVGYFISNNIVLGLGIPLRFLSSKSTGSSRIIGFVDGQQVEISRTVQSELGIAPLVRGYIGGGKLRPFLQTQVALLRQMDKVLYQSIPESRSVRIGAAISGGPGLAYFISENTSVEASLNAVYNDDIERLFPPTSIGLYFGLQFYLPK